MNAIDLIAHLIVGSAFFFMGFVAVKRQDVNIGFGRPPLTTVHVDGLAARILSVLIMIGGGMFAFPVLYQLLSNEKLDDNWAFWLPFLGIVTIFVGVLFGVIIQWAIGFGEGIRKNKDKYRD